MFKQEFQISFDLDSGILPFGKVQTVSSYKAMAKAFKAGANEDWKQARREFKRCVPKKYKDTSGVIRYDRKNNKSVAYHTDGRAWANLKDKTVNIDGIGEVSPYSVAYGLWAHTKHYHLLRGGHYMYGHYPYHYYYGQVPKVEWTTRAEGIAEEFQRKVTDPSYVRKIMEGVVINKNYELFTKADPPDPDEIPEGAEYLKYREPEIEYKGASVYSAYSSGGIPADEVMLYDLLAAPGGYSFETKQYGWWPYDRVEDELRKADYAAERDYYENGYKTYMYFLEHAGFPRLAHTQQFYAHNTDVTALMSNASTEIHQAMRTAEQKFVRNNTNKTLLSSGVYDIGTHQWTKLPTIEFPAKQDEHGNYLFPFTRTYGVIETTAAQITQEANRYMITAIAGLDPTKRHTKKIVFKN